MLKKRVSESPLIISRWNCRGAGNKLSEIQKMAFDTQVLFTRNAAFLLFSISNLKFP